MAHPEKLIQRQIGRILRQHREARGLSRAGAARFLSTRTAKLRHYEEGTVARVEPYLVAGWVTALGATQKTIDDVMRKARLTGIPDHPATRWEIHGGIYAWLSPLVTIEQSAEKIQIFESDVITGLLQTPEYMRAIAEATLLGEERVKINEVITARQERQTAVFERRDGTPNVEVILGESAFRRIRHLPLYRKQVEHLRKRDALERVSIAVLPEHVGLYACMNSAYHILNSDNKDDPDVVYVETPGEGAYVSDRGVLQLYRNAFEDTQNRAIPLHQWNEVTP